MSRPLKITLAVLAVVLLLFLTAGAAAVPLIFGILLWRQLKMRSAARGLRDAARSKGRR